MAKGAVPKKKVTKSAAPVAGKSKGKAKTNAGATTAGLCVLYVRLLKNASDMLLSIDELTDDDLFIGSSDNYWELVEGPVVFARLCLAACPTSNDAADWKAVLSVVYNETMLRTEFTKEGPFSVDGKFTSFQLPELTDEEKTQIAPLVSTIPRKLISKYKAYPNPPTDPSYYAWRTNWVDDDHCRQHACDHVEYLSRRIWEKIAELTPRLMPDHGIDLSPPTSFLPVAVALTEDDFKCQVCKERPGVKACTNGDCVNQNVIYCIECAVGNLTGRFCNACAV